MNMNILIKRALLASKLQINKLITMMPKSIECGTLGQYPIYHPYCLGIDWIHLNNGNKNYFLLVVVSGQIF